MNTLVICTKSENKTNTVNLKLKSNSKIQVQEANYKNVIKKPSWPCEQSGFT